MSGEDTLPQIGPYELLGELGRGGMGVVYRARHRDLGREVALKVITTEDPRLALRFEREARAAARLAGHANIVGVHDVGRADDRLYLAMDYVAGCDFEAVIAAGELTPDAVAAHIETVARAVAHAHAAGILHRDLKPANLLLGDDGVVRVTDFGLARIQAASAEVTRLTQSGEIVGTPAYMAPEQARGDGCDARADVWALCVTLHHMLGGTLPFHGSGMLALLTAVIHDDPEPLPATVAEPLRRIVAMGLSKRREQRYASAGALADDLARYRQGEAVHAASIARVGRGILRVAVPVIAGAAITAGLAGLWWWQADVSRRASHQSRNAGRTDASAQDAESQAAAWYRLTIDGRADLELLEDAWYGAPRPADEVAQTLRRVTRTVHAVRDAYPGTRAWQAWLGLAQGLSGDTDAAAATIAAARAGAGDDPFPDLLAARWALATYAVQLHPPSVYYAPSGVGFEHTPETYGESRARELVQIALQASGPRLRAVPLAAGNLLPRYVAAGRAFAARDYPRCAELAAGVVDDQLLGAEAALMCGLARYSTSDFLGAEHVLRKPAARGWRMAMRTRAQALSAAAIDAAVSGTPSHALFEQAAAAFALALQVSPHDGGLLSGLASTHFGRGKAAIRAREPATEHFRAAIRLLDRALEREPKRPDALSNRATAWRVLASVLRANGEDPTDAYRRSLADYDAALQAGVPAGEVHIQRGSLWLELAQAPNLSDETAAGFARRAVVELDLAVALHPDSTRMRAARAHGWMQVARFSNPAPAQGRELLRQALADLVICLEAEPGDVKNLHRRAMTHLHLGRYSRNDVAAATTWVDRALTDFTTVLAQQDGHLGARRNRASAHTTRAELASMQRQNPVPWFEAALADLTTVARARPNDWRSAYDAGVTCKNLADAAGRAGGDGTAHFAEAERWFSRTLATNARHANAWAFRGRVRTMLRQRDPAIADLREAIRLSPGVPWMQQWLAEARAARPR